MTGPEFAALRKSRGLTQTRLADEAQTIPRMIQKIEAGELLIERMTLRNAHKLARTLGVTMEDLLL